MKYILSLLTTAFLFSFAQAQDRSGTIWCFGDSVELDFNSGAPVSVNGSAMSTNAGSASIADKYTGQLLFYSDGVHVWDATNTIMPSDTIPLGGNKNSTQSALIVPYPGSATKYYLFTVDDLGGTNNDGNAGASYSIIDMNLHGGLGDILQQPQTLIAPTCEKLAAVRMANEAGYWLVVHVFASNAFFSFPLTAAGIGYPVNSLIGAVIGNSSANAARGYMRISPDGTKIAAAHYGATVDVFSFNNATGKISDLILSDALGQVCYFGCAPGGYPYGISFSPNSNLFYFTNEGDPKIYQYDLTAGTPAAVAGTKNVVGTADDPYALQLGPDGKIYIDNNYTSDHFGYLSRINNPDVYGTGCNFQLEAVPIDSGEARFGLPDYVINLSGSFQYTLTYPNCSSDTAVLFADTILDNNATYLWNFGDTATGTNDTSTLSTPTHTFSSSGNYLVSLAITTGDGSFIISKNISAHNPAPTVQIIDSVGHCTGAVQLTAAASDSVQYLWSPSTGLSCVTCPNPVASPHISTEYYLNVTDSFGCSASDSVNVAISVLGGITLVTDKHSMCLGDSAYICVTSTYDAYEWNTGATTKCIYANSAGNYYATATLGNDCGVSDYISVTIFSSDPPVIQDNQDTLSTVMASTYQWFRNDTLIPNATMNTYIATESGSYTVAIRDTNGCHETSAANPITVTGIDMLSGSEWVRVYPNPSSSGSWKLAISNGLLGSTIEIYDDNGKLVYESNVRTMVSNFSPEIASGIYTLRLISGNASYNLKLIKL